MKPWMMVAGICLVAGALPAQAGDASGAAHAGMPAEHIMHDGAMHADMTRADERISLGLGPMQKQHQLANMRSHLEAVQDIVGLIAENRFDEASAIAHDKLGLTPEMEQMCDMFADENFRNMGLAFHRSADELGEALKRSNTAESLQALRSTMNHCIRCHAAYRQ